METAQQAFNKAARHLDSFGSAVPGAVTSAAREGGRIIAERAAVLTPHPEGADTPKAVGAVFVIMVREAGRVWIQFRPRYLLRWFEGGTKAHKITPKSRGRLQKRISRATTKLGTAFGAQDAKTVARTARRITKLQGQVASTGVLHITPKGGDEFYARYAQVKEIRPRRPLRKAIAEKGPEAAALLRAHINTAWTK